MITFTQKVWKAMEKIPKGRVTTYQSIARAVGSPHASRAVGNACNQNPNAPHVPCHRVVKTTGELGGYAGGVQKKIQLLKKEGVGVEKGKIVDFDQRFFEAKRIER